MNKKITSSALAALMIAGSTSFSALAAMANGTVVIGTKAFDMAYANDPKNADEIGNAIVASGAVYVKDFEGNWIDNNTTKKVEASVIPAVTYKNAAGVVTQFAAKDMDASTELKLQSVTADNLNQVVVKFTTALDKTTATDKDNYSLNNSKTIKSAVLSEDKMTVTLSLDAATPLLNQVEYKLSFNNIKSEGAANVLKVTDSKFTPVDSKLPVPEVAEALGNKTVKITFSEPVKVAPVSSFLIDAKPVVGYTQVSGNSVVIKVYSPLTNGTHEVNVKNVEDYANFKSISQNISFSVVEDTTAPTVTSVESATFESVVVKFSEVVDKSTVIGTNVYWMQGTSKKYADSVVTQLADDTFEFTFSGTNKLQYATLIYMANVKDYSGNIIDKDTKFEVKPVLDQTRPEVVNAELDDNLKDITIKFSKVVNQVASEKSANFVIKDKDGKEVNKLKTALRQSDNKTVKLTLASALEEGKTYTLEVSAVSDDTTLKNVMLPYSKSLAIEDVSGPDSSKVDVSRTENNTIVVNFPEVMDVSGDGSIVDISKYLYSKDSGTTWKSLPSGAVLNVTSDGKAALITLPTSSVLTTDITNFRVQLVKDTAGNYLTGLSKDIALTNAAKPALVGVTPVVATATNEITLEFDRAILTNTVNANDFTVKTAVTGTTLSVVGAKTNSTGKKVILTLADANKLNENKTYGLIEEAVNVSISGTSTTSSPEGKTITAVVNHAIDTEEISATVKTIVGSQDGSKVVLTFNESLDVTTVNAVAAAAAATDFLVVDTDGNTLTPVTNYTVSAAANTVTITFAGAKTQQSGVMTVTIQNPRFVKDLAGNVISSYDKTEVSPDNAAPTATLASSTASAVVGLRNEATGLDLSFIEKVATVTVNAGTKTTAAGAAVTFTAHGTVATLTATGATAAQTINFTITDEAGYATTYTATFDGTIWTIAAN